MSYDAIVVGAGFAGATVARKLAEAGKQVLVLEKRNHIGGNAYDQIDQNQVLRHIYGPHIFHTNDTEVVDFLSAFTSWMPYEHKVLGMVQGKLVPIPFNLTSIDLVFPPEQAKHLKEELIAAYGMGTNVPILKLRESKDPEILKLADFIYENVFKYYTMKQWGLTVEQIDPQVTNRVPVRVSTDDRYFQDAFQQMPIDGYTALFQKMFDHPGITVQLTQDAREKITLNFSQNTIDFEGKPFTGNVIYTGQVDALLQYRLGELPYRSLNFDMETKPNTFQPVTTVNYPTPETEHAYTRITEFKHMMKNPPEIRTTICTEYPMPYDRHASLGNVPYYPVFTKENQEKYQAYREVLDAFPQLMLVGRLAEYKYYNMDAIVARAIQCAKQIL